MKSIKKIGEMQHQCGSNYLLKMCVVFY